MCVICRAHSGDNEVSRFFFFFHVLGMLRHVPLVNCCQPIFRGLFDPEDEETSVFRNAANYVPV
jgi:hypothetical protein